MVEAPHDTRRLYHSRAARDNRAGAFPLQKDTKRQVITFRLLATRGFPPTRAGVRALRPSPRPRFGPSALLATAQTLLASRVEPWDV